MTTTIKDIAKIGEEISGELASKMIKLHSDLYETEPIGHIIGGDIILKILSQKNCKGIKMYKALNERAQETLVYVGVNEYGEIIPDIICDRSYGVAPLPGEVTWSWF